MNKLVTIVVILTFAIICNLNAQVLKKAEKAHYYWFNLKIKSIIHKNTHKPTLATKHIYRKINSGNFSEFVEFYKKAYQATKLQLAHMKVKNWLRKLKKVIS